MKRNLAIFFILVFILGGATILESCRKNDPPLPATGINFIVPPGFPQPTHSFSSKPLTKEGILLGRKLFYDGRLSLDGNFPCSSCHNPEAAFTTKDHDRSHGYNNSHTLRNAPGLFNLAWHPFFNQDGSAASLQAIYAKHITDPTEMAETIASVINKLKADATYKAMFKNAFGDEQVSADRMYKAMTQFLVNMVSANSKYDKVLQGLDVFNPQEQSGYQIFQSKCGSCHQEPLFTDYSFRNVGLEINPALKDYGLMMVTGRSSDSLKFRVPSLRNLEFTSYYSHDGRFSLPRHMIQHYRFGVNQSATLDPLLTNGIVLSNQDENDLVHFLRTLSDSSFLNNPANRD